MLDEALSLAPMLPAIGLGLYLFLRPYHVIRLIARLQWSYLRFSGATDEAIDRRVRLPWDRYVLDGLTLSQFLREAMSNPRRFVFLTVCIRLLGFFIAAGTAFVLVLGIAVILTG